MQAHFLVMSGMPVLLSPHDVQAEAHFEGHSVIEAAHTLATELWGCLKDRNVLISRLLEEATDMDATCCETQGP